MKEEKKSALFTIFWKEKLKKKLEIVCELENGKISGDREIIGEMRKIENNKRKVCCCVFVNILRKNETFSQIIYEF